MRAGRYDFQAFAGSSFGPVTLVCKDANGDPVDLTGYTAHAQVRVAAGEDVLLDLSPQVTDAAVGEVTLPVVAPATTTGLAAGVYRWDFILKDASGAVTAPVLEGRFKVSNKISEA